MKTYPINTFLSLEEVDANYPTHVIIPNNETLKVPENMTAYGFVVNSDATLIKEGDVFNLLENMYFCLPGEAVIQNMLGFVCLRKNYTALFTLGGPVEKVGRMKYIDGCSDTLLLSPLMRGEPCLNYLYVPANIDQTLHTHPSVRVGCVLEGTGYCLANNSEKKLTPGSIFILKPEEEHSFHTTNDFLRIAVFHPDSDFGPTHEEHPMINRTYREGVSMRGENSYRTQYISE